MDSVGKRCKRMGNYMDKDGTLLYLLKSCVDTFTYQFKETDPETGKEIIKSFSVVEKRIVSYNPALAKKQHAEIMKMVDKARISQPTRR